MNENEKEVGKSKRDELSARLSAKHPDQDFSDDEAFFGQIGVDYDSYEDEINGYKESERTLTDLFARDPRSASFLSDWQAGDDPVVSMVRHFGPDFKEALEDPENVEALAKASAEYYARVAKSQELDDAYAENWPQTMQRFSDMVASGEMSEDEVDDVFGVLRDIVNNGVVGIFSEESIRLALKAIKHDSDVADADHAGEVRGRNTRIEEKLRKPQASDGTVNLDGKNGLPGGARSNRNLGALASYDDGSQTIWERGGEKRTKYQ